jgi:hypothetical protein
MISKPAPALISQSFYWSIYSYFCSSSTSIIIASLFLSIFTIFRSELFTGDFIT